MTKMPPDVDLDEVTRAVSRAFTTSAGARGPWTSSSEDQLTDALNRALRAATGGDTGEDPRRQLADRVDVQEVAPDQYQVTVWPVLPPERIEITVCVSERALERKTYRAEWLQLEDTEEEDQEGGP